MKKRVLLYMVVAFALMQLFGTIVASANVDVAEKITIKESELFSKSAVLMDATSGRVLYGKNEDLLLPMASTTKIMTCILALEYAGLDEVVTASSYAAAQPKVKLYLKKGEQVLLKDLLYSLMLESHNDSAVAIAEHIGAKMMGLKTDMEAVRSRSEKESKEAVKAFVDCMNQKARELQCYDTFFVTPNGLDGTAIYENGEGETIERIHSTTATELAKIMSYCILFSPQKEMFLEITGTYQYSFWNMEKTKIYNCQNHNAFLNMMDGALSGKTGYTGKAGYCYVGALERDGRYYVVALLNSGAYGNKTKKWTDTKKLMNYGITYFQYQTIYKGGVKTEPVEVYNARPNVKDYYEKVFVETRILGDKEIQLLLADWEETEVVLTQQKFLTAPVRENEIVGQIEVKLNGEVKAHFSVVCTEKIEAKTYLDSLKYIVYMYITKIA